MMVILDSPVFRVMVYFAFVIVFSGVATWIGFKVRGDDDA